MRKLAVITGGSRGLGRAMALSFAKSYDLALISRSLPQEEDLIREVEALGARVAFYRADVSREEEVVEAFSRIKEDFGSIYVLINNAGITKDGSFVGMTSSDFLDVINVNLLGSFLCAREAMKLMMRKREGLILNISSVVALQGNAGQANYAASKAGLLGLTRTLAKEYGSRNIRVNALAPGFIESDMTWGLSQDIKDRALDKLSLRRFGRAQEVAELAYYLASADYVTGQVISIDGGLSL